MRQLICILALGCAAFAAEPEPLKVTLLSNLPSPQPVGTAISLVPRLKNSTRATYVAQYSVSVDGGAFHMIRDFSQDMIFTWAPELYDHQARVRVTVRDNDTMKTAAAELPFQMVSRVKDGKPVVTPTSHPLVALFSAPPCPAGNQFRVEFRRAGDSFSSHTSAQPCRAGRGSNVYVAGMRADTDYQMRAETAGGAAGSSAWLDFHTGILDVNSPPVTIPTPRAGGARSIDQVLVSSVLNEPFHPQATDLEGNVVWTLSSGEFFLTRVLPGGRFLVLADAANSQNDIKRWQAVRELDLLGRTVRETNASRVAEQLASRGIRSKCMKDGEQCVCGFHHEAIRLPNDHTLVIAGLERMFPDGAQGSKDPVDVMGDLVIDLDPDFQVAWVWNSFDHMDVNRKSLGDEKCKLGPGTDGCASVFLAATANGWLHSNALNYIPGSGDFLISVPEQDWVVKVDYKDGKGTGKVLWRLGVDGDFKTKSDDPYPWFSYQHDVGFDPPGSNRLIVFDDGDRRKKKDPKANNRGQVWELDEQSMTATLVLNADLGVYSPAVGSAQSLSGGGYSFHSGFLNPPVVSTRETEVGADGKIVYAQQFEGAMVYRSFRVPDLYTAPRK
ncbi:MAG TPA: aryl-sulfate sulfotransferase [Bryobacteraceae bacterium]|nr:aryl-sulfate sulfotransferase [Bryobacteraceae bacterium]